MSSRHHPGLYARWLVASPLALVLLVLAVSGASAHQETHFSGPSISPRHVQAGSAVALGITYKDAAGAPKSVVAQVGEVRTAMTPASDSFASGVRYAVSVKPARGWHAVAFRAVDAGGTEEVTWQGFVYVEGPAPDPSPSRTPSPTRSPAPTPTTKPAPTPIHRTGDGTDTKGKGGATPAPKATPTPAGQATPTPNRTAATGPATPAPLDKATPAPQATTVPAGATPTPPRKPTPTPIGRPSAGPGDQGQTGPGSVGSGPTPTPGASPDQTIAYATSDPGQGAGLIAAQVGGATGNVAGRGVEQIHGAVAVGPRPVAVDLLASYRHTTLDALLREMAPTIATATAGGAAWCAFVLFGKRRRDGDEEPQSDSLLAAAAGSGVDTGAAPGLRVVDESTMPRWRRPSLQQVRRTDPLRAVVEAPHMSFATTGARSLDNYERRIIRYRLVRLLDCPDEVRAAEIGVLDRGDEVQLVERHGVYWRVGCPDGRTGWVHRMTLGDPASDSTASDSTASDATASDASPASEYEAPFVALLEQSADAALQIAAEQAFEAGCAPELEFAAVQAPDPAVDGLLEAYMRARSESLRGDEQAKHGAAAESAALDQAVVEPAALEPSAFEPVEPPSRRSNLLEPPSRATTWPRPGSRSKALKALLPRPPETAAAETAAAETAAVETVAVSLPEDQPSAVSEQPPAAKPARADAKCSGRKSAGTRKASTASRPGTKSRRPSR